MTTQKPEDIFKQKPVSTESVNPGKNLWGSFNNGKKGKKPKSNSILVDGTAPARKQSDDENWDPFSEYEDYSDYLDDYDPEEEVEDGQDNPGSDNESGDDSISESQGENSSTDNDDDETDKAKDKVADKAKEEVKKQAQDQAKKQAEEQIKKEAVKEVEKQVIEKVGQEVVADAAVAALPEALPIIGIVLAAILLIMLLTGISYFAFKNMGPQGYTAFDQQTEGSNLVTGDYEALKTTFMAYKKDGKILTDSNNPVNDVNNGEVTEQTLRTVITIAEFAASKGQNIRISVFKSGHSCPGSLHCVGKGVDIANEEVADTLMPWLFGNAKTLQLDELIFDNRLIAKPANFYNLDKGKPHTYGSDTLSGHDNHIHLGTF